MEAIQDLWALSTSMASVAATEAASGTMIPHEDVTDAELVHECPWPRSFRTRNWWWKWKSMNRLQPMPSGSAVYRWVALGPLRSIEFAVPLDPQGNQLSGRGIIQ